jgi:hypothetical protein
MPTEAEEKLPPEFADVPATDPITGTPWTEYMDGPVVVRYLKARGIKRSLQTLAHQRAAGAGIRWVYLGQKPMAKKAEIDRHIEQDLFTSASPLVGKHHRKTSRKRATRRRS